MKEENVIIIPLHLRIGILPTTPVCCTFFLLAHTDDGISEAEYDGIYQLEVVVSMT